mgnify:CR=1 FL=1
MARPLAGMLLADMGADVLIVDRPAASDLGLKRARRIELMNRGTRGFGYSICRS